MWFNILTKKDLYGFREEVQCLEGEVIGLEETFEKLKEEIKPNPLDKSAYERIADLEVKMAKLWGLLTEQNAYGKEKLTKFGRKFGGQATRHNNQ